MTQHFTLSPPRAVRGTALDAELAAEQHRIDKHVCTWGDPPRSGYVDGLYIEGAEVVAKVWSAGRYDKVRAFRLEPVGGRAA